MKKDLLIVSAGLLFGITGLIFEVSGELQSVLRILVLVFADILILLSLRPKISKKYFPAIYLFGAYFISIGLSTIINDSEISFIVRELFFLSTIICLYILLSHEEKIQLFFKGFIISLIILNFYYLSQIDYGMIFDPLYRSFAKYGANGVGKIAAFTIVILVYFIYKAKSTIWKIVNSVTLFVPIVLLIASKSRTSFIFLIVSWILMLFILKQKKIAFFSIVFILIIVLFNLETIMLLVRLDDVTAGGEQNIYTLTGRTDIWMYGLELIKQNIFFGIGPYQSEELHMYGEHVTMDNSYLFLYLYAGMIGFIAIIILVLITIDNAFKNLKINPLFSVLLLGGYLNTIVGISLLNIGTPDNFLVLFLLLMFSGLKVNKFNV